MVDVGPFHLTLAGQPGEEGLAAGAHWFLHQADAGREGWCNQMAYDYNIIYIYIYTYAHTYIYIYIHMHIHTHIRHIHIHILYIHIHIHILYIYIYIHILCICLKLKHERMVYQLNTRVLFLNPPR